jgi:uncharacterized protein
MGPTRRIRGKFLKDTNVRICVKAVRVSLRAVLLGSVHAYRMLISPCLGARCRFHPSCSLFALQALRLHGSRWGVYLILKRLARCHPWCLGGYDPVPPAKSQARDAISTCEKFHV